MSILFITILKMMNCFSVEIKIIFIHKEWNHGSVNDGGYESNVIFMIIYSPVKNIGVVQSMRFVLPASNPRQILEGDYVTSRVHYIFIKLLFCTVILF